jgi:hypothetical protein
VKVIVHGQKPSERVFRGTCWNCKSVMEATVGELKITYGNPMDPEYFGQAPCPVCEAPVVHFYPVKK